jgi:transcriptional regulator with XRE-family HTH domain
MTGGHIRRRSERGCRSTAHQPPRVDAVGAEDDDVYVIKRVTMMFIAARMLRHARRRAGLTQRELAARVGIPQETISRIESGRIDPRVSTLDRLLEGCGFGLEHGPRPGVGVDRTLFTHRRPPSDRAAVAAAATNAVLDLLRDARPVGR